MLVSVVVAKNRRDNHVHYTLSVFIDRGCYLQCLFLKRMCHIPAERRVGIGSEAFPTCPSVQIGSGNACFGITGCMMEGRDVGGVGWWRKGGGVEKAPMPSFPMGNPTHLGERDNPALPLEK